ncbi:Do family serine endopeptidase [Roseateles depolymerans]|uniref:Probable periplasmic serine endoprotease DegP-like n=1 Tax=Roseateles depolymerans TaxID=76731 RepID=A0A0U3L7Y5_9BURK|nr:Do family serine endopeptidase [Roseateles depolymerans]ALV07422.1 Putative protease Do [Roseateles depolymerans]REG22364.1 serine protease Do [Roseateles depolymerans]
MAQVEKMISAKKLVWALAAAGVLGATGGALAMRNAKVSNEADSSSVTSSASVASPGAGADNGAPSATSGGTAPLNGAQVAAVITPLAGAAAPTAVTPPPAGLPDFAQIAATQGPAVVNISVSGTVKTRSSRMPQMDPDDPFYDFFRRFGFPGGPGGPGLGGDQDGGSRQIRGQGSGFIVSNDGIILTNAHVVQDAQEVVVKLTDRREFRAKVLGSDKSTDVAVLKIDAKNLPTVRLGSTKDLRVGEWVLAIGSPFGFENSVSAGVISAKGRSLGPEESRVPFLQTDVAINPGNSGGPLFNARGEVVGINSQIYSASGGYQGLSFAIPVEVANKIRQQIQNGGKVQHARLGVMVQEVNQGFADSFKLERPEGALVANVEEGSPAAKSGLRPGDVILSFKGQPIVASGDLPALVDQSSPGDRIAMEVWRGGKREQLSVVLGDAKDRAARQAKNDDAPSASQGKLGLALRPLQAEERRQLGIREGLLIEEVSGPAARAQVRPGDVLLAVNGTPVQSVDQVRNLLQNAEKSVALLVQRGGDKIFVPVRIG